MFYKIRLVTLTLVKYFLIAYYDKYSLYPNKGGDSEAVYNSGCGLVAAPL